MNGRFQPGRSGNPGGRPKAAHNIQELARKHAPEAIKTLADIAEKGPPGARVSAAIALLDRAITVSPIAASRDLRVPDVGNSAVAWSCTGLAAKLRERGEVQHKKRGTR